MSFFPIKSLLVSICYIIFTDLNTTNKLALTPIVLEMATEIFMPEQMIRVR